MIKLTPSSPVPLYHQLSEVRQAAEQGQVGIERPGIVVNMPLVRWPGGER